MSNAIPDLTQINSPTGRHYEDEDGIRYPSVTTVLNIIDKSEGLTRWAAKLERELVLDTAVTEFARLQTTGKSNISAFDFRNVVNDALPLPYAHKLATQQAADIGSEVHQAIEHYLKGEASDATLSPEAQGAFNEFQRWWGNNTHRVLLIEQRLVSKRHRYAGTVDMLSVANLEGTPTIIDFKTSKYLGWSYSLQLAAYREALSELGYPRAETGLIVKLPKTRGGKFELHPIPDLDTHFQSFLHALALYNAQQEGDPWIRRRQESMFA